MDAVTYPDAAVTAFVSTSLVPVRVRWDTEPLATNFSIRWTPTVITLDPEGREHHRTVGYLTPEDLIASLLLGIAKWHLDARQFGQGEQGFESVLQRYASSDAAPEALYLRGVARYRQSHNLADMGQTYRELVARYRESEWTKRAAPYSQVA